MYYFILIIPIGLTIILFIIRNNKLKKIAKSYDHNYSGNVNNTLDFIRLIKIYLSNKCSKEDSIFIRDTLFLIGINWLMILITIIIFIKRW